MTNYRDKLLEEHDQDVGSVVGCGLDRLDRQVNDFEISMAIAFFEFNKNSWKESGLPIGSRRELIQRFVENLPPNFDH